MDKYVDGNVVIGDAIRQRHTDCRNCCVLLGFEDVAQDHQQQGGAILACGLQSCYVLTVKTSKLMHISGDLHVTFGDRTETIFQAVSYEVHHGSKLSIIHLRGSINAVLQEIVCSVQQPAENVVVHTLSYAPRSMYERIHYASESFFTGGLVGLTVSVGGVITFFHNCSAGYEITVGSSVFDAGRGFIGMNLNFYPGSTMSLSLIAIRQEIEKIFPETINMDFEGIRQFLQARP